MQKWFFIFGFLCVYISGYSQQLEVVNFTRIHAEVKPDYATKSVSGTVEFFFKILKDTDSIFLDAKQFKDVTLKESTTSTEIINDTKHLIFLSRFRESESHSITFTYTATPQQAMYFVNNEGHPQIWTQGQGKYTSHWLPSIDDMNDKIEFDLKIFARANQTVIANGSLINKENNGKYTMHHFDMENPMSSYLVAIAIGTYAQSSYTTTGGLPVSLYYYPEDSLKVEPTYRYTQQILDYLEGEIGVPFPWQSYKQVPVKDFLYAGMENTTATFFSDSFIVDTLAFPDRNYVNVNAHELAHQWFGDLVTETSSTHHWLQEGFATYYALLAERHVFGEDYFYWQLYQYAERLKELSDAGKGEKLLRPDAGSITYYQKGAWALHILRERVGEGVFKMAVIDYLENHAYENVNTQDFIETVERISGKNLDAFKADWLEQKAFKASQALQALKKSAFIQEFLNLKALRKTNISQKETVLRRALESENTFLGQEAVYQLADASLLQTQDLYTWAFKQGNSWVRQALATSVEEVPKVLKSEFESLLNDDSYVTREHAFIKLWMAFPKDRINYLNKLKGVEGFADKNIELLWLALSLATPDYEPDLRDTKYTKLVAYTAPKYAFEIRENAFKNLYQLQLFESTSLSNLINACVHHNWRFANSSREILGMLLESEKWKEKIQATSTRNKKEADFLKNKLQ